MDLITTNISTGLNDNQAIESRNKNGSNSLKLNEERVFLNIIKEILLEPMFLLLLTTCIIYFSVGKNREGIIMIIAIFIVAGISLFQEFRSRNAILALKKLSASKARVSRNGLIIDLPIDEIVVDDIMHVKEGEMIAADGKIISSNDFSLNESILTGETFTVNKSTDGVSEVYRGTMVSGGSADILITAVGINTMFGKIGLSLQTVTVSKTPLQIQIRDFVRYMIWIGLAVFILIVFVSFYHTGNIIQSLLQGMTLAMSILPEEIPVAFSTFQALGAYRLLKNNNIVVKQPQFVETLGSATVICSDKTGTITQNKMSVAFIYDAAERKSYNIETDIHLPNQLIEYAMWSSEIEPFDPMEKAIHELYEKNAIEDKRKKFKQIHEYPLGGNPPMMTHIFSDDLNEIIIAVKGAPEAILRQSDLSADQQKEMMNYSKEYAGLGYRVLGVGKGKWNEKNWPFSQEEFVFQFIGLIAFYDPPKENIISTIQTFYKAGISFKMITGDYPETALAIARQIKLIHNNEVLIGQDILKLDKETLRNKVKSVDIYARMFPEAKLKVINALKENGEVVAMTGDGVNDGPALKAAHIGIAMGLRGSEVAKNASSLILTDDDLSHMTDAIALGRKIYGNLKKAIQYIVSIHIPIILIVTLPLLLMWRFTNVFSPVHVIFLELIMGPTCSIIYENEPMEYGTMLRKPLKMGTTFLSFKQLSISIIQGLIITAGCLSIGFYYMNSGAQDELIRAVIFITLLFSNILLTLINRSFVYSVFKTIFYKNNMIGFIVSASLLMILLFNYVPFFRNLFGLSELTFYQLGLCFFTAVLSTCWFELFKLLKNKNNKSNFPQ